MRGEAGVEHDIARGLGITPACAGRSCLRLRLDSFLMDHPRVCGEKAFLARVDCLVIGSPPRVRGEGESHVGRGGRSRITPACAGRSPKRFSRSTPGSDHPRVRGEKSQTIFPQYTGFGSPPRARGEVARIHKAHGSRGITPACAGRSRPAKAVRSARTDHPRVRGEKLQPQGRGKRGGGSPPRARGEVSRMMLAQMPDWITPACAGRRLTFRRILSQQSDHPRVRGEKCVICTI